jgi:hypothetical protein
MLSQNNPAKKSSPVISSTQNNPAEGISPVISSVHSTVDEDQEQTPLGMEPGFFFHVKEIIIFFWT